jgi:hypothetical protein
MFLCAQRRAVRAPVPVTLLAFKDQVSPRSNAELTLIEPKAHLRYRARDWQTIDNEWPTVAPEFSGLLQYCDFEKINQSVAVVKAEVATFENHHVRSFLIRTVLASCNPTIFHVSMLRPRPRPRPRPHQTMPEFCRIISAR